MTFAIKIKKVRLFYGLSQSLFAEKIGVNRKHYCGWENGRSLPKLITLIDIAQALDTSVSDILEGVTEYD